ncbi:MAG: hypothetical protein MO852_00755 [Candidatus Devosia euplotis]|nr:hypothetical protein [Candidatus Devosia euplotis]
MIAETTRKGIYDRLDKAELVAVLGGRRADVDLVTAADVFIYYGSLQPVLVVLLIALMPGGLVRFPWKPMMAMKPCSCAHRCVMLMGSARRATLWWLLA